MGSKLATICAGIEKVSFPCPVCCKANEPAVKTPVAAAESPGTQAATARDVRGHAMQLISKLNGLAISGCLANSVLHMAMQVSHSLRTGKQSPGRTRCHPPPRV